MKVLHVIPSVAEQSGGPAQALFPMCVALQQQGAEIVIACTDHGLQNQRDTQTRKFRSNEPRQQDLNGIATIFFPFQWGDSFKYSRPFTNWLDQNVSQFDVVHIHAVFNHSCIAAASACRHHGVPYIVRPLGTLSPWSMQQKPLRKWLFWRLAGMRMLEGAAVVHYTAKVEKEATEFSLGLNHGRVVPLGVYSETENLTGAHEEGIGSLQVDGPYVLVLSRLHPKKGLDVLLDAFLSVTTHPQFKEWRLVFAGDGPEDHVGRLRETVRKRRAHDQVLFTGWLQGKKKSSILKRASLLALPSYDENFGLCVMEAMAVGVPVLVSRHVSLADDINAAKAGWIEEVDQESLAATLKSILSSPEERTRRGAAGKDLSRVFTWPHVADQLFSVYREVAARSVKRAINV